MTDELKTRKKNDLGKNILSFIDLSTIYVQAKNIFRIIAIRKDISRMEWTRSNEPIMYIATEKSLCGE